MIGRTTLLFTFLISALALTVIHGAEPGGTEHLGPGQIAQLNPALTNSTASPRVTFELAETSIWQNGVGNGFGPTTQSLGLSAGATRGLDVFGSRQAHDLALVCLSYGHMLGPVRGEGHWYRGNLELRVELFTGAQFSPNDEWLVGLTPHLRYHFATGTRWIPFFDAGAGVTGTGIGPPDLSGTFEFNLQAGGGVQWFLTDKVALSVEARYVHWSCASISKPNLGLNGVAGLLGITFFF
jgi:lipid A 3-O-deacylase